MSDGGFDGGGDGDFGGYTETSVSFFLIHSYCLSFAISVHRISCFSQKRKSSCKCSINRMVNA